MSATEAIDRSQPLPSPTEKAMSKTPHKDRLTELLRKTPKPEAIDSLQKAKGFKAAHAAATKKIGSISETQAAAHISTLSAFF